MQLLCRNRVKDFDTWWEIFEAHALDHQVSGLTLQRLWRSLDDPNNVFFLFRVEDRERAEAFLNAPESAEAGERAGVIDGEFHFIRESSRY